MNSKDPKKTACKSLNSLFSCLLICLFLVLLGASMGYAIKEAAPVEVQAIEVQTSEKHTETHEEHTQGEKTHEERTEYINLGEYEITAYCPCSACCGKWADGITSTGVTAKAGRTIAVDPSVIPYGTELIIDGIVYRAEDCGGAIKGKRLDIYFDTHAEALEYGRQTAEVYLKIFV